MSHNTVSFYCRGPEGKLRFNEELPIPVILESIIDNEKLTRKISCPKKRERGDGSIYCSYDSLAEGCPYELNIDNLLRVSDE